MYHHTWIMFSNDKTTISLVADMFCSWQMMDFCNAVALMTDTYFIENVIKVECLLIMIFVKYLLLFIMKFNCISRRQMWRFMENTIEWWVVYYFVFCNSVAHDRCVFHGSVIWVRCLLIMIFVKYMLWSYIVYLKDKCWFHGEEYDWMVGCLLFCE